MEQLVSEWAVDIFAVTVEFRRVAASPCHVYFVVKSIIISSLYNHFMLHQSFLS